MAPRVTPSRAAKVSALAQHRTVGGVPATYTESIRIGCHDVTKGDLLRVAPSAPRRRDGFVGKFRSAWVAEDGTLLEVNVVGATSSKRPAMIRTYRPERLAWVRQPKETK